MLRNLLNQTNVIYINKVINLNLGIIMTNEI